jgi:NTE family protein
LKNIFALFLIVISGTLCAQVPKVGLVFSGGGARAMAQLGALKVMEEEGVQFDYVGGTSMGGIFGAMVAMGYTSEQIIDLLSAVDWNQLQSGEIPREQLSYVDKKLYERYVFGLAISNWRIKLPRGLNSGHYVLKNLDYLLQQGNHLDDFSQLPIPFFCVAANITNGKLQVFDSGKLSLALRASSAFPSVFFPFEIDGELYVDGGVLDNFPAKTMKDRGADIIIGVDAQNPSYQKEDLDNALRVLEQIATLNNYYSNLRNDSLVDVLIRLESENTGLFDFNHAAYLIQTGYEEAHKHREDFRAIAALQQDKTPVKPLELPKQTMDISKVILSGKNDKGSTFFKRELGIHGNNKTLKLKKLNRKLDEWMGSKHYEKIHYTLVKDTNNSYQLHLDVVDSDVKTRINASAHYDDDFGAALLLNFNRRDLFFENAHFNLDFAVSENPRTWIEYSTNLGIIPSAGIKFRAHRFRSRIYDEGNSLAQFRYSDVSFDAFLRSTIAEVYAIGGGIQIEQVRLTDEINILPIENKRSGFINYYAFTDLDTYDRTFKPTKGIRINGMYRIIAERVEFEEFFEPTSILNAHISQAVSWRKKIGLEWWATGAFTIGPDAAFPYNIFLGGLGENYINYSYPFIGYRFMELIGRNALTAGANFFVEVGKNNFITAKANWGKLDPSFDGLFDEGALLDGYGLSYGIQTPVGPLEINVMTSSNHWQIYTYFALGYWF